MDVVCWENYWDILSVEKMAKLYLRYFCTEKEIKQYIFLINIGHYIIIIDSIGYFEMIYLKTNAKKNYN